MTETSSRTPSLRRAWLLLPVALALVAFFGFGLDHYVTLKALAKHREWLLDAVAQHRVAAPLGFVALYVVLVGASVPGATFLTIVGGFLFGTALGAALTVLGATLGATVIFLLARTALGDALHGRAGDWVGRLEAGLRQNALFYLLFLRLVPLFPFVVVNLVPALLGVGLCDFVVGTALGIVPGTVVFAGVGSGLGEIFDSGGEADLQQIGRDPRVWLPMVALALLALVPVAYKRWRARGGGGRGAAS